MIISNGLSGMEVTPPQMSWHTTLHSRSGGTLLGFFIIRSARLGLKIILLFISSVLFIDGFRRFSIHDVSPSRERD